MELLAVYGTLRDGLGIAGTPDLRGRVTRLWRCRINGSLFDLGPYPTLRLEPSPLGVVGEVLRIDDPTLLADLDRYEGFDANAPATSLFVRERTRLLSPALDAFVYRATGTAAGVPVPHGDWRLWLATKR